MKTKIITAVIALTVIFTATSAMAGTDLLPKGVKKFQDGDITCYTYFKSISCLNNPQPSKFQSETAGKGKFGV